MFECTTSTIDTYMGTATFLSGSPMKKCFLHNLKDVMVICNRAKFHFEIR